jgi:cyclopropane-fatty-acyl-phospholipid synthase
MLDCDVHPSPPAEKTSAASARGFAARMLRHFLRGVSVGRLVVTLPDGAALTAAGRAPGMRADLQIKRWRAVRRLFTRGDIGFAEGYRDGDWETSDLKTLLTWALANEEALARLAQGSWAARFWRVVQHRRRANTRANSRRNIAAHYDLGNTFYAGWLDAGMNYSSAVYRHPDATLEEAQAAKLEKVVGLLDLSGGERILEIGCGWGALMERLAADPACRLTGLTLSAEQHTFARHRLQDSVNNKRAELRMQDYRDVTGSFDRIVSIEMLEAVGEKYWPVYFDTLRQRLKPGGKAVLQVITIDARCYPAYRARPDFIQTYIFPGGMLPTREIIRNQIQGAGLRLLHEETFGQSYARTLADWRVRFNTAWPQLVALGFDERFRRLWNYYLVYCEVGFEAGTLDVGLYQLERPAA